MRLLAAALLLLQEAPAEETYPKIEQSISSAETLRIRYGARAGISENGKLTENGMKGQVGDRQHGN